MDEPASLLPALFAELFRAPVLRVTGPREVRGKALGGVVLRCDTHLHPQKRDTPLQFAFYKYSRAVRRFDWGAEYTVPEPEVEELESYWCEAATATRSVRKRSPWLQLPGPGECLHTFPDAHPGEQPCFHLSAPTNPPRLPVPVSPPRPRLPVPVPPSLPQSFPSPTRHPPSPPSSGLPHPRPPPHASPPAPRREEP